MSRYFSRVAVLSILASAVVAAAACASNTDVGGDSTADAGTDSSLGNGSGNGGESGQDASSGSTAPDSGSTGTGSDGAVDMPGVLDEATYATEVCDLYIPCCSAAGKPAPTAACATALEGMKIPNGVFNPTNAATCLAAERAAVAQGTFCTFRDDMSDAGAAETTAVNLACSNVYEVPGGATASLGDACSTSFDCIPSSVAGGQTECNLTILADGGAIDTCQQVLPGKPGSTPCIDDTGNSGSSPHPPLTVYSCAQADGLFCNDGTSACVKTKSTGAACDDSSQCVVGDYCDIDSGLCAARLATGKDCTDGQTCIASDYCAASTSGTTSSCAVLLPDGSASSSGAACASGTITNGMCVSSSSVTLNQLCL